MALLNMRKKEGDTQSKSWESRQSCGRPLEVLGGSGRNAEDLWGELGNLQIPMGGDGMTEKGLDAMLKVQEEMQRELWAGAICAGARRTTRSKTRTRYVRRLW